MFDLANESRDATEVEKRHLCREKSLGEPLTIAGVTVARFPYAI